jgi:hypothetical protein
MVGFLAEVDVTLAIRPEVQRLLGTLMREGASRDPALAAVRLLTHLLLAEERHMEALSVTRHGSSRALCCGACAH